MGHKNIERLGILEDMLENSRPNLHFTDEDVESEVEHLPGCWLFRI